MKRHVMLLMVLAFSLHQVTAQKRETRNVSEFSAISFGVPGKCYLRQGNTQKVELVGDADVLEKIETEVSGDRLSIRMEDRWFNWNWGNDDKIVAYVTVKNIKAIDVSGSGDLIGEGKFSAEDMSLRVSGSGSLNVETDVRDELKVSVSGSGNIDMKGSCRSFDSNVSGSGKIRTSLRASDMADFSISGSGKIEVNGAAKRVKASVTGSGRLNGADLETDACSVRIAGSGDVEINVKNELDANITGSGSVLYKGNPSKINSNSSGSGKVRKM